MANHRFLIEYDGTGFEGWQQQRDGHRTVQGCVSEALAGVVGGPVTLMAAGRTDAGVHAEGQVAHAHFETRIPLFALREALNARLPDDVAVLRIDAVPETFDARRHAQSKLYRYRLWNRAVRSPLHARRSWWVRTPLDSEAMRRAAQPLCGKHDFASFQAAGSNVKTSVRTLLAMTVAGEPGGEVLLDFEGDGFLRHMVRNLVGTLVEVGRGRRPEDDLARVLAACDRRAAGPTAPARGLTLVCVRYPEDMPLPPAADGTPPAKHT